MQSFNNEVTKELQNATKYLDLKSYDMSIEKIEKDVAHFFKELAQTKTDTSQQFSSLTEWREQLSKDMQVFYDEYDAKINEATISDEERQLFRDAVRDLNNVVDKNSENIKLIAKELTDT